MPFLILKNYGNQKINVLFKWFKLKIIMKMLLRAKVIKIECADFDRNQMH